MRRLLGSVGISLAVCLAVNPVWAEPVVIVGHHQLMPDLADQTIEIMVAGGDAVQGLTLRVQVADGGTHPMVGGLIEGPRITDVDLLTDTIFGGNNTTQMDVLSLDQIWVSSTTTSGGTVAAEGLLARVTLDTRGFMDGTFALSLHDTHDGPTDFAGIGIAIDDGTISIVPEPGATVLLLAGLIPWGIGYRRRARRSVG